ncbi:MAG: HD domain-containing phosphohydrolase [Candidatus Omnitrophota bacterium]
MGKIKIKNRRDKKIPYEDILTKASRGMVLIKDMDRLLNLIARIVKMHVKVRSVAIFQHDHARDEFVLKSRRGENKDLAYCNIVNDDTLVRFLKKTKKGFLADKVSSKEISMDRLKELKCSLCIPSFWRKDLLAFLILGEKLSGETYSLKEVRLLTALSDEVAIAIENARNVTELERLRERERRNYFETVLALARTVDEKDSYTRGHLDTVAKYGIELAKELVAIGKIELDMEELKISLLLHDIGKIGIPDALLNKNGKLTDEEYSVMKQHSEIGERIVKPISRLKNVSKIIRHHQERYDGLGYPDGLKGDDIPLSSRIIAVVDSFHAMISDRPYRKALPNEAALKELIDNKDKQFDPIVVDAFMRAWEKGKIVNSNQ